MGQFIKDLELATRSLRRARAFTGTAILSLTAGIVVIASSFAVTNAYLVRSMPFPESDRLVRVMYAPQGEREPRGLASFDWSAVSDIVEWADVSSSVRRQLIEGPLASDVLGVAVPPRWFEALGVRVTAGRTFLADESIPSHARLPSQDTG